MTESKAELARREAERRRPLKAALVNPASGELIPPDAPTDELARELASCRELAALLRSHVRAVSRIVIRRMDEEARWTADVGRWKVSSSSPTSGAKYDGERLERLLGELVAEGAITAEAMRAAVTPVTEYEVRAAGVKRLRALGNPHVDAALADATIPPDPEARRVTVAERARPAE